MGYSAGMRFSQLKRRYFISLLAGATAWPFVVRAQSGPPVIGFLNSLSPIETD